MDRGIVINNAHHSWHRAEKFLMCLSLHGLTFTSTKYRDVVAIPGDIVIIDY
jgi:hypothetical protein